MATAGSIGTESGESFPDAIVAALEVAARRTRIQEILLNSRPLQNDDSRLFQRYGITRLNTDSPLHLVQRNLGCGKNTDEIVAHKPIPEGDRFMAVTCELGKSEEGEEALCFRQAKTRQGLAWILELEFGKVSEVTIEEFDRSHNSLWKVVAGQLIVPNQA